MFTTTGIFIFFLNTYLTKTNVFLERLTLLYGFLPKNILLAICIMMLFFTASGIPPFSLFFTKVNLIMSMSFNSLTILLFILFISAVISSFYYIRVVKIISFSSQYTWLHINKINYISSLMLIYIVLINFIYFYISSYFVILGKYIVISNYSLY